MPNAPFVIDNSQDLRLALREGRINKASETQGQSFYRMHLEVRFTERFFDAMLALPLVANAAAMASGGF